MNKVIFFLSVLFILAGCKPPDKQVSHPNQNYNYQLSKFIFSNPAIKAVFDKMFDRHDSLFTVFKVLVSRRDKFVRITIYGMVNRDEISEYPSGYFIYHSKIFLCYDGSEVIYHKKVTDNFMNRLKEKLTTGVIYDTRVLQFDIDQYGHVKLNIPAVNPYDYSFDTINFNRGRHLK